VTTNKKAIANRGWGPKALNYNVLLHPEIHGTKHGGVALTSSLESTVEPEELNLSHGLAATLVDRIVMHKNKEASRNGVDAEEQRRKRKATAEERLQAQDKRISAGLLAAAGHYNLGDDVGERVQSRLDAVKEKECNAYLRRKDEYDILEAKVREINRQNLPHDTWNTTQLKIMVKWYKRDGDAKLPTKKQELLDRYLATCDRQELPPPQIPDNMDAINTPPALPSLEDTDIEANVPPDIEIEALPTNHHNYNEQEVAEILLATSTSHHETVTAANGASAITQV
jgi:hypothetical protein